MPRKKGKFIDKKKAVSFRLVHRSQRDPLAADDDAPQHVLQPLDGAAGPLDPEERRKTQVKYGVYFEDDYDYMQHLRSVEEYHNVHLSEPINAPVEVDLSDEEDDPEGLRLFRKTSRGFVPIVQQSKEGESSKKPKASASKKEEVVNVGDGDMRLPASVFASGKESKVGLVNKGAGNANPSGPLIGWDPDIVEALDEDFDLDDPDNILDDDFVLKANQDDGFNESDEDEDDSEGDWTSEDDSDEYDEEAEGMDVVTTRFGNATSLGAASGVGGAGKGGANVATGEEVGDLKARIEEMKRSMAIDAMKRMDGRGDDDDDDVGSGFGDFDDLEETKSRFTEYSMTSSVIRRNDQLTLLDDRFEKLYEQYDDDQIGGLDGEDLGSGGGGNIFKIDTTIVDGEAAGVNPFNDILREFEKQNTKLTATEVLEKLRDMEANKDDGDDDDDDDDDGEELVKMTYFEKSKEKNWDCESILSTYSNLYNHPKTIEEPSRKKKKKKTGVNDDDAYSVSSKNDSKNSQIKLSAKSGLPLGVLPETGPTQRQLEAMDYDGLTRLRTAPTLRPTDESAEERRARKKAVKEERRERRMEKKANTAAFKDEEKRQKKNINELKTNIQGIKIQ